MKISTAILILMSAGVLSSAAQQSQQLSPQIDMSLMQLQSKDSAERAAAYQQLKSDPAALQNTRVRAALLDLLDHEAERMSGRPRPGDRMDDVGTEGIAEYFSELAETVRSFVDWDDSHQACVLVNAGIAPSSNTPEEAAHREKLYGHA